MSLTAEDLARRFGGVVAPKPATATTTQAMSAEDLAKKFGGVVAPSPAKVESTAASPAPDPDTGVVAALKRIPGNLDPRNLVEPNSQIMPTQDPAELARRTKTFESGLQHFSEHPIASALGVIPFVGPALQSFVERLPRDPSGAITEAVGTAGAGALIGKGIASAPEAFNAVKSLRDINKPAPELTFLRNVPGLAVDVEKLKTGMSVLKDGEAITGKISKDVPTALENGAAAQNAIHRHIDSIILGQEDIVVPGSRAAQIAAQVQALPETYRPGTPAYKRAVTKIINDVGPRDYTIGELNRLRKDLSATQSPYYGKDIQGQLTMEAGPRAADIARGNTVRDQFYKSLNDNGNGGTEIVREGNRRLGSLITLQDVLNDPMVKNKALLEAGTPRTARVAAAAAKIGSPVKTLEKFSKGETSSINEDLASALRRWQTSTPLGDFATGSRPGTEPPRNAANELIMTHKPEVMGLPAVIPKPEPPTVVKAYPIGDSRFPMPESSLETQGRFNRALTTGQKMLPAAGDTAVKVTPPPPESFAEALKRTESAQSARMRETMGKGPYDKQARPATAEEYLRTRGSTDMPNTDKYEAKKAEAPTPPKGITDLGLAKDPEIIKLRKEVEGAKTSYELLRDPKLEMNPIRRARIRDAHKTWQEAQGRLRARLQELL